MKFKKDDLRELASEYGSSIKQDTITGVSRWSVHHEVVFEYEGKLYRTKYSRGATESQDERPYQYDEDEIECPEVIAYEKTITAYKEKTK